MKFFGNDRLATGMTDAEVEKELAKAAYMRTMGELKAKRETFKKARERLIAAEKAVDKEWDAVAETTNAGEVVTNDNGGIVFNNEPADTYTIRWSNTIDSGPAYELATLAVVDEDGQETGYVLIRRFTDDRDFFVLGYVNEETIGVLADVGLVRR